MLNTIFGLRMSLAVSSRCPCWACSKCIFHYQLSSLVLSPSTCSLGPSASEWRASVWQALAVSKGGVGVQGFWNGRIRRLAVSCAVDGCPNRHRAAVHTFEANLGLCFIRWLNPKLKLFRATIINVYR